MIEWSIFQPRIRKLIEETIQKKIAIYQVEPEILDLAKLVTRTWLRGYQEVPRSHWKSKEIFNIANGIVGQECLHQTLEQLNVYHLQAIPLFARKDSRAKRDGDYKVLGLGSIEVKTIPRLTTHKRIMVRCDTWEHADYVVAIKLFPELDPEVVKGFEKIEGADALVSVLNASLSGINEADFMGWLTGKEVEQLPIENFGEGNCYWCFLDELHPMYQFFDLLLKAKQQAEK